MVMRNLLILLFLLDASSAIAKGQCAVGEGFADSFYASMNRNRGNNEAGNRVVRQERVEYVDNRGYRRSRRQDVTRDTDVYRSEERLRMSRYDGGQNEARRSLASNLELRASDNLNNGSWGSAERDLLAARDLRMQVIGNERISGNIDDIGDLDRAMNPDMSRAFNANTAVGDYVEAANLVSKKNYGTVANLMQDSRYYADTSRASELRRTNPLSLMQRYRNNLRTERVRLELYDRAIQEQGANLQSIRNSTQNSINAIQKEMEALARSIN